MPLGFVARYARDYALQPPVAAAHVVEYLKFLAIKSVTGRAVPPPLVDAVFHHHLTFTKSYQRFCIALLGENGFIHHEPCTGDDAEMMRAAYSDTLALYTAAFGEPPRAIWIATGDRVTRKACVPVRELLLLRRDAAMTRACIKVCLDCADCGRMPAGAFCALFQEVTANSDDETPPSLADRVFDVCGAEIFAKLGPSSIRVILEQASSDEEADAKYIDLKLSGWSFHDSAQNLARAAAVSKSWYVKLSREGLIPACDPSSDDKDSDDGDDDMSGDEDWEGDCV